MTKRIGMITPSSNTVLESVTTRVAAPYLDEFTVHYTRIEVKTISLETKSLQQFTRAKMLEAARLLADAKVDVIAWNGTSASWTGLADDEDLCAAITAETGAAATTATLAQLRAFAALGVHRFALAVPYLDAVRLAIVRNFESIGIPCPASAGLNLSINHEFAEVEQAEIHDLLRRVDHPRAEAIAVVCTNFAGAYLVDALEAELGKPIVDSVLVVLWDALRLAGLDISIPGWGRLLRGGAG